MELRRYWEIILRRKWIFIGTFFVIVVIAVIGANIATPIYEANTKILIESSAALSSLMSKLSLQKADIGQGQSTGDTYETEIALANIRPIIEKLISDLNLKDWKGEKLKPKKIEFSIVYLILPQPYIGVEQYEESDILEITAGSTNPAEAAKMANELAQLYIADTIDKTKEDFKAARLFVENQLNDVKEEYYKSLSKKKDFMIKEETVDLQEETKKLLDYISNLKDDYKNNEIAIIQASETISLIEKKIAGKEHASSNLINDLESKLHDLLVDLSGKKIELTEEHPDILRINKEINTIRKLLKDKMEVIFGDKEVSIAPVYEELVRNLKDAYINEKIGEIKRQVLKKCIDKTQDELMNIPYKSTKQSEIDLSLSVNQDIYRNLLSFLTQISVAEYVTLSNIKIVEPAVEPDTDEVYFPKKVLSYALGIFLGLFWGLFLSFFIEYIDNTIKGPEDLKNYRFTFLGSIPKFKRGKHLVSEMNPDDLIYESYRKVLSGIHFAKLGKPYKKLLISSINQKEGSSTTVVNLGIILAKEGKKVLLVDADLRIPNIHQLFKLPNTQGLGDLLLGNADIEKVICKSGIEGLNILPAGSTPPDSGLLIKSDKMQDIIRNLEERYDILLFHSAPLLLKNDAVLLMKNLDDMIILVRNNRTTHPDIYRTDELLKNAKITPIGVILNCV